MNGSRLYDRPVTRRSVLAMVLAVGVAALADAGSSGPSDGSSSSVTEPDRDGSSGTEPEPP